MKDIVKTSERKENLSRSWYESCLNYVNRLTCVAKNNDAPYKKVFYIYPAEMQHC